MLCLQGAHFVQLCCQRKIPLLFLQNITGEAKVLLMYTWFRAALSIVARVLMQSVFMNTEIIVGSD